MSNVPENLNIDPTLPLIIQRFIRSGGSFESIRLDAGGRWWHEGAPFKNRKIIRLFSRSIEKTDGGTWILHIPPFIHPIQVDAVPLFVQSFKEHNGALHLNLSDGTEEISDLLSLQIVESGGLHLSVKDGKYEARFLLSAYLDFVDQHVHEIEGGWVAKIGERSIPLNILNEHRS